jgi:hypothetical protein
VRSRAPRLPAPVADAIDQCLARHAGERFESAARFVEALDRAPEGGELPAAARATRAAAAGALSLTDWTFAIGYATVFLVLGEAPRSFGRILMAGIGQGVLTFAAIAAAFRAAEAVLSARTALTRGVAPSDVAEALAPAPAVPHDRLGASKAIAMLVAASTLAFAQATVDTLGLPEVLEFLGNAITWLAPPVLVQRALAGMRRESGVSGWLYSAVRKPLAQRVVRWLGGRTPHQLARAMPASGATEVLLGEAAQAIFARLPAEAREALTALPAATAALAEEAMVLRARADELSAEYRRVRLAPHLPADLARIEQERAVVKGRLGTTIAALESIRLDLLRLEADRTMPGSLTEQLSMVRELQRRVDAAAEVQRALNGPATQTTPV